MARRIALLALTALLSGAPLLSAGCASSTQRTGSLPTGETNAIAPALSVERFLRAANAKDLQTMANLFGTEQGSISGQESAEDVERRMYTLAEVLRHTDYSVGETQIVPGRLGRAVSVPVFLELESGKHANVPFTVVRSSDGSWLVEKIGIESIVGRN